MKAKETQFVLPKTIDADGNGQSLVKTERFNMESVAVGTIVPSRSLLGAKGGNLVELTKHNLPVPDFFVVAPDAFFESLSDTTRHIWNALSAKERMQEIQQLCVANSIMDSIYDRFDQLGFNGLPVAVRSSSPDEDGNSLSYAGQFLSVLNVEKQDIAAAIANVWRSAFTPQVMAYRELNGIDSPIRPPSVIIQRMVNAKIAGVAFGADPISSDTNIVTIAAVEGLGDKLVSGETDSATYQVSKGVIVKRDNEHLASMSDEQLLAVSRLAERAGSIFGQPQDIEWAVDHDATLYIVQARPITTLLGKTAASLPEDKHICIFDNSNIAESYPGITTPLTFSFARKAYQHVYEEFCRLMGVSEQAIEKHAYIFPQMLGFIRGRIYYNLLNWYVLLSLFPGFTTNRKFMEQMMGVKSGLPDEITAEFDKPATKKEQVTDAVNIALLLPKLLYKWHQLPTDIKAFHTRVDFSLQKAPARLDNLGVGQLAKLYRSLEQDLLLNWDAPIVNDFFAMICFGVLKAVCDKWLPGHDGIHNKLLCGETGIISTEPVRRMNELARLAANDSALMTVLKSDNASEILEKIARNPDFNTLYIEYMNKFGDRCTGELKLESPTVTDNPIGFLRAISNLASDPSRFSKSNSLPVAHVNRVEAETAAFGRLRNNPLKALVFKLLLDQTRTRIRERENLRFMRTRVFGIVRRIFAAIGKDLAIRGKLSRADDIFFLEIEEVLRYIEATSTTSNLKVLVETRRIEQAAYENMAAPKDRLVIKGGLHLNGIQTEDEVACSARPNSTMPVKQLQGLGCCPGILKGKVRVIDDPNSQHLEEGEILVAKRTDPGWITVIAQAKGIIVEYGSLLSHTAIVARELGIPTIVSVSGVTTALNNGDRIEMNGATGLIKVTGQLTECHFSDLTTTTDIASTRPMTIINSEIEHKASFDFVRYAQCWEDSDILVKAMSIKPGDTCLSIASAGDNSLALLASNPGRVVALDMNPAQLALMELKVVAFKHLSYDEMLVLLGYRCGDRVRLYDKVKQALGASARRFWESHLKDVESGVASIGKFENYFRAFRTYVLPLVHSRSTVEELLKPKIRKDRETFYINRWNTRKWNMLFNLFFSEPVMGLLGRDPSFFTYAENGLASTLRKWVKLALVDQDPSQNPYLHWILKGRFGTALPYFLRPENFESIKKNIDNLEWHQMSVEEYLSKNPQVRFNSFNLSDIFEYMSEANYATLMQVIAKASQPEARLVYWNMMAPRSGDNLNMTNLISHADLSNSLFVTNQTFFYSRFVVEEISAIEVPLNRGLEAGASLGLAAPSAIPERAA
ncbi:MAG: DUF3419 family protein [Candidatus Obscuribacterales bacterium]|nr:DUF3419 family protein [Candidatus Obscuribacterales bacterium]